MKLNVKLSHPDRVIELWVVIYWRKAVEEAGQWSG